jgi:hypothetical protein
MRLSAPVSHTNKAFLGGGGGGGTYGVEENVYVFRRNPIKSMRRMRLMFQAHGQHVLNAFKHLLSMLLMVLRAC